MALVPTSRQLHKPSARGPQRSTLRMSTQLESLEPQLKRVVITGMGIVSCLGNPLDDVADSLYHARSGIKHMPKYTEIGMKSQVAGRPELDLNDKETIGKIIDRKSARFMGDNAKYAFLSMHDAIEDAKLPKEAYQNNPRAALRHLNMARRDGELFTPFFGVWGGLNDRFAYGAPRAKQPSATSSGQSSSERHGAASTTRAAATRTSASSRTTRPRSRPCTRPPRRRATPSRRTRCDGVG